MQTEIQLISNISNAISDSRPVSHSLGELRGLRQTVKIELIEQCHIAYQIKGNHEANIYSKTS